MYPALEPGAVGIRLPFEQMCALARKSGFKGVPAPIDLAAEKGADAVRAILDEHGLVASHWGCPVNINAEDDRFEEGLSTIGEKAMLARALGCDRCATWMRSWSDSLPYAENLERMAGRIRRVAEALAAGGHRFGVEYLGPKTLRDGHKHPFVCTMKEMLSLLEAAGGGNLGLLVDSWHWHCAGDSVGEIEALSPEQVVLVHVSDAPPGVPADRLVDNRRELPGATGVIDIEAFVGALGRIGYDGPVVVEPFNKETNEMEDDAAAERVYASLGKIMG